MLIRKTAILVVLLVALATKGALVGRGALSFHDEIRYVAALETALHVAGGRLKQGIEVLFDNTNGRPAVFLYWLPAITAQVLFTPVESGGVPTAGKANIEHPKQSPRDRLVLPVAVPETYLAPKSMLFAQWYGVLISLVVVLLVYELSAIVFRTARHWAAFAALVYALFPSNSIYIRHLFPYDGAIACMLLALILVSRNAAASERSLSESTSGRGFLAGLLCGIGFCFYPGYCPLILVVGCVLAWNFKGETTAHTASRLTGPAVRFGWGVIMPMAALEIVSLFTERRYSDRLAELSRTVTQGSFDENLSFIFKYLTAVAGSGGVVLLALGFVSLVALARPLLGACKGGLHENSDDAGAKLLAVWMYASVAVYLLYAISGRLLESWVMYGRLVNMYVPVVAIASVWVIATISSKALRGAAAAIFVAVIAASHAGLQAEMRKVSYPQDVAHAYRLTDRADWTFVTEYSICHPFPIVSAIDGRRPPQGDLRLAAVNLCMYYPFTDSFNPYEPPGGGKLIYSGRHFASFPMYQYEGYVEAERENLLRSKPTIRVYELEGQAQLQ